MINKQLAKLLPMFVVMLLVGCANSSLKMELSIYKDDPLFKNVLTQDDIKPAKAYLNFLEDELDPLTNKQLELAKDSYVLFLNYWMAQGVVETKKCGLDFDDAARSSQLSAMEPLRTRLVSYQRRIEEAKSEVILRLKQAYSTYGRLDKMLPSELDEIDFTDSSYIGQVQRQQRLQQTLSIEISRVLQALDVLVKGNDHVFYKSTKDRWGKIQKLIESDDYKTYLNQADRDDLSQTLETTAKKFIQFDSGLVVLRSEIKAGALLVIDYNEPAALVSSMMENPTVYAISAKKESDMLRAVDLLNSQLDRLQNASSPIWRIVTDPDNAEKWNTEFSETHFYAEGNSGVVVVRDSPIKYRVQEATNNPAALVQAQLQVSRAVADAAIQIAGASTGVPLVSAAQTGEKISKADNTSFQEQTDTLVIKKAKINAQKRIYLRSIDAIEGNIDSYLRQLKELTPKDARSSNDQVEINALSKRIFEFLKAQEKLVAQAKIEQGGE
ncbi:hypothetical protein [Pseudoalteromonas agarivorans]|uniref:Uncharacterized protein n=1 Tax=Pseudoalteromonas agarivorans TaxID=176102 RepID=A0AAD0U449_9GAMM|nr:hypothetical protein [Pseudoalteromonas agarivorans]AYM87570.1 hypothetical protein D9T18_13190 [Pseudoalteromonas agarivorans]